MQRTKDEIIESHIKKLIGDKPRLDIFAGVNAAYQYSRYVGHTQLIFLGMLEWVRQNPEGDAPLLVVADDKERFTMLEEFKKHPELENVIMITVQGLKNLPSIPRAERPLVWTMHAIIRYAHEGHLVQQNILMLERARALEY